MDQGQRSSHINTSNSISQPLPSATLTMTPEQLQQQNVYLQLQLLQQQQQLLQQMRPDVMNLNPHIFDPTQFANLSTNLTLSIPGGPVAPPMNLPNPNPSSFNHGGHPSNSAGTASAPQVPVDPTLASMSQNTPAQPNQQGSGANGVASQNGTSFRFNLNADEVFAAENKVDKSRKRKKDEHSAANKIPRLTKGKEKVILQPGRHYESGESSTGSESSGLSSEESEVPMDEDEATTPTADNFAQAEGSSKASKKTKRPVVPLPSLPTPPPIDPRIVDGIEVISGTYHSLVVQYQELRKDIHCVSQLTQQNQSLLGSMIGAVSDDEHGTPQAFRVFQFSDKEMDDLLDSSLLQRRLAHYKLHVNHGKVFVAAVNAHLMGLLKLKGLSRNDMRSFEGPSQVQVEKFLLNAPDRINFDDKSQFTYSFDLQKNHRFNTAARAAFFLHFERSQGNQHWLHAKIFDKRLVTPDLVREVVDKRLKYAKSVWTKRFQVKPELSLTQKHQKRVNGRVNTVEKRRLEASTRADVKRFHQLIAESPKTIHSDDDSGDEGKAPEKIRNKPKKVERLLMDWRSLTLTLILWMLDSVKAELGQSKILISRSNNSKQRSRPAGLGNAFRMRMYPKLIREVPKDKVPKGLPINCYSRRFLASLSKWERLDLCATEPKEFEKDGQLAAFAKALFSTHPHLEELLKPMADGTAEDLASIRAE